MIRRAVLVVLACGVVFAATACGSTPKDSHGPAVKDDRELRGASHLPYTGVNPTSGRPWGPSDADSYFPVFSR